MPPQEHTALLSSSSSVDGGDHHPPPKDASSASAATGYFSTTTFLLTPQRKKLLAAMAVLVLGGIVAWGMTTATASGGARNPHGAWTHATGPYHVVSVHEGQDFFDGFSFYQGADSLGSAGYLTYQNKKESLRTNLANVTTEHDVPDPFDSSSTTTTTTRDFVYLSSLPTERGPRDSVRLEGTQRYDRGLFVLDLRHLPTGCGVWPAFWLTDESVWPDHGEIDIVEGINTQTQVKTAMHTSDQCDMYAHVPSWSMTGTWDRATGLPETFTGQPDTETNVPADNCWVMAPHRWANQGCVIGSDSNRTLGAPLNEQGGGVFVLEWDPANTYIRSWAYTPHTETPANLQEAIATANTNHPVTPDPHQWGPPYAHFAIGEGTGCSSDHFQNMHLVINLAFCGMVAGNRFLTDCPAIGQQFGPDVDFDPIATCNKYIASQPESLAEAYWKIGGVYVYQRGME